MGRVFGGEAKLPTSFLVTYRGEDVANLGNSLVNGLGMNNSHALKNSDRYKEGMVRNRMHLRYEKAVVLSLVISRCCQRVHT
jgi:hypothetical protein